MAILLIHSFIGRNNTIDSSITDEEDGKAQFPQIISDKFAQTHDLRW